MIMDVREQTILFMRKFRLFVLFVLFGTILQLSLPAQEMPVKDVPPIIIETNKKFFLDDHTTSTITIRQGLSGQYQSVGELLKRNSPVLIRNYGAAGSLTSISMRGTGSNHTQITWNGIPLNSPTTGQADLSMIPSSFVQTVEIINGASGSLFGSGTFGGAVNLENEPDWQNIISFQYVFNVGSFGALNHFATLKAGNRRLQYQLSAVKDHSKNNFSYADRYRYNTPERTNDHNEYNDIGIIQNFFLKLNDRSFIEAGAWYQQKSLEIPALMGSYKSSNALQNDSLFRSFLNYRIKGSKYTIVVRTAWLSDFLNYRDRVHPDSAWGLDSRISSSRLLNQADFRYFLTSNIIAGGGAEYNYLKGKSNNYGGTIHENEFALYGNVKYVIKSVIFNVGLRKEFYTGLNPQPQYAAGIRYIAGNRVAIRSSFSTKFRKPGFNEKYWRPGGNPDLHPEKGKGAEIAIDWISTPGERKTQWLDVRISGYYQNVDTWIQWVMLDSLTPVEYKKVHARGIETRTEWGITRGSFKYTGRLNYNCNFSIIADTKDGNESFRGNQLIYVPKHSFLATSDF